MINIKIFIALTMMLINASGNCHKSIKPLKNLSNSTFLEVAEQHASVILQTSPEWASSLGVSEEIGGKNYPSKSSSYSDKENKALVKLNKKLLRELNLIDKTKLIGNARATYDIMHTIYQLSAKQNQFAIGLPSLLGPNSPYVVNQLFGLHLDVPRNFINQTPLTNKADIANYLSRLSHVESQFDEMIEMLKKDKLNNALAPRFILESVIESSKQFTKPKVKNNPIYTSFVSKIDKLKDISKKDKKKYKNKVHKLLKNHVYKAYEKFADSISNDLSSANIKAGVWQLKNGDNYYQNSLNAYGANGLTAQQIHEIGNNEVQRIHGNMNKILQSIGYKKGTVADRMKKVSIDPKYILPNTDKSRQEILATIQTEIDNVMAIAPQYFANIPENKMLLKRIPIYEQDTAPLAYYNGSSLDGSRPGTYWVNLKDTADWPTYTFKSLTYHEGVPGHHFQAVSQLAIKNMPLIRNMMFFYEYGEGWALYVEELALEMGMYKNDKLGNLGRLRFELYRAARLVVDTGLHYKRWSREQAIQYMVDTLGESRESITREIDRYIVWPGQATSYKLGMIKIKKMRRKAEKLLRNKFDIRYFHDALLQQGSMPMPALEIQIDNWIKQELKK